MFLGIITLFGPFSSTFFGLATFDTSTAWDVAITFLTSHRTFRACLTFLRHTEWPDKDRASFVQVMYNNECTIRVMYEGWRKSRGRSQNSGDARMVGVFCRSRE